MLTPMTSPQAPAPEDRSPLQPRRRPVSFLIHMNVFGLGLMAMWTTINTLVLPDRVEATAPDRLQGSAIGLANIATAGAGAMAGVFGQLVDLLDALIPGSTYQLTFGLAALVTIASIAPLRKLQDAATPAQPSSRRVTDQEPSGPVTALGQRGIRLAHLLRVTVARWLLQ